MVSWRAFVCVLGSLTLVTACSKKNTVNTSPAPVEVNPGTSAPGGNTGTGPSAPASSDSDEDARRRAERMNATLTERIHFGYDQADLSAEAQRVLQAKLAVLRELPELRIRIEGHADERGSDQYNVVLGQQRAAAVKRYLVGHSIADSRLEIISFGEERPICLTDEESCWAQNRRAEFQVIGGADRLR